MRLASLPMYDWPESRDETAATWAQIRAAVAGLPDLSAPDWAAIDAYWRNPDLVFSQCCWGPLSLGLIDWLKPLAQPDYSAFLGGRGPMYRSALIARAGLACPVPDTPCAALPDLRGRRFALNGRDSLSGFLSVQADLGADPCDIAADCVVTGGHRASVVAVAEGRADIAAIDCRSWDLARRFEPAARDLVVVGWTAERPGLPYVTSRATDPALAAALQSQLRELGCHPLPQGRET